MSYNLNSLKKVMKINQISNSHENVAKKNMQKTI